MTLADCLQLFADDPQTDGIVLIGEIGGLEEEQAADAMQRLRPAKPVVAYVAGRHAPPRRRMGHAGAVLSDGDNDVAAKQDTLRKAGITVVEHAHLIGRTMKMCQTGRGP
jgi:succinyl-CoA synthetase alpha subunit